MFQVVLMSVRKSMLRPGRLLKNGMAPDERAEGAESEKTTAVTESTDVRRDQPHVSTQWATGTSRREIVEVSAAIVRSKEERRSEQVSARQRAKESR